eukprot:XP_011602131.1 PREDICTED: activating transcription factor 7-interacting protein 2 [Takifugu rubripes]
MERFSSPPSPGTNNKKFKFSQFDVQSLVEQEVRSAMERHETKLKGLIETIEHLDRKINYESTIQKLEVRINMVSQKAEAALAQMAKRRAKARAFLSSDSEENSPETSPQRDRNDEEAMEMDEEIFKIMETTKSAIKKMQHDKLALTAAAADLSEERCLPAPECKAGPFLGGNACELQEQTKDPKNRPKPENHPEATANAGEEKGRPSPPPRNGLKCSRSGQCEHTYPPLPPIAFPSVLSIEAASYSIPPKPSVRLVLIRKPARLSVLWNIVEKDPFAPPMDNYTIYMSVEKDRGSRVFSSWTQIGLVQDRPLPICAMISKYKPGHKVGVAVVGKDRFGRYGPYSDIVTATIPD